MTREIALSQGKVAIVDDADYERVNQFKWCAAFNRGNWYGSRRARASNGKSVTLPLHRFILNAPTGMIVDHIDGDGLNCCRNNMRLCNQKQNSTNKRKPKTNTSGYKGVSWSAPHRKWRVKIKVDQKTIHIGMFTNLIEAARAYDSAARKHHGIFARTNFPSSSIETAS